jgi:hypothetical protein
MRFDEIYAPIYYNRKDIQSVFNEVSLAVYFTKTYFVCVLCIMESLYFGKYNNLIIVFFNKK